MQRCGQLNRLVSQAVPGFGSLTFFHLECGNRCCTWYARGASNRCYDLSSLALSAVSPIDQPCPPPYDETVTARDVMHLPWQGPILGL